MDQKDELILYAQPFADLFSVQKGFRLCVPDLITGPVQVILKVLFGSDGCFPVPLDRCLHFGIIGIVNKEYGFTVGTADGLAVQRNAQRAAAYLTGRFYFFHSSLTLLMHSENVLTGADSGSLQHLLQASLPVFFLSSFFLKGSGQEADMHETDI